MALNLNSISKTVWLFFLSLNFLACTPSAHLYMHDKGQLTHAHLEQLLSANPLSPDQNIRVTTLGKGKDMSHHLVQIRDHEKPHVHKTHDLTVAMLKGKGYLMLDQKRIELRRGDVLFIPQGSVHYFVNTFAEPSVGLAVFSPVFKGKDSIPVGKASTR